MNTISQVFDHFLSDDHSRIILTGNTKHDYINASYIDVRYKLTLFFLVLNHICTLNVNEWNKLKAEQT